MSEVVKRQVVGTLSAEQTKPGSDWAEFHVDIGRQYPVKISTKLDSIKDQARAVYGHGPAVWTFEESDGAENPNRPGTFYKNRRLQSVILGTDTDPALAGQQGGTSAPKGLPSADGREQSIERQVILKALAPLLEKGNDFELEEWWLLVRDVDAWFGEERKKPTPTEAGPVPPATTVPSPPQGYDRDDDIPF